MYPQSAVVMLALNEKWWTLRRREWKEMRPPTYQKECCKVLCDASTICAAFNLFLPIFVVWKIFSHTLYTLCTNSEFNMPGLVYPGNNEKLFRKVSFFIIHLFSFCPTYTFYLCIQYGYFTASCLKFLPSQKLHILCAQRCSQQKSVVFVQFFAEHTI